MRDSCFAATAHFAPTDTTITVSNDGALPYTFTDVDCSFDTGQVAAGESAQLTSTIPVSTGLLHSARDGCRRGNGWRGRGGGGRAGVDGGAPGHHALQGGCGRGDETIWQAMDNQGRTMGEIRSVQADIEETLEEL